MLKVIYVAMALSICVATASIAGFQTSGSFSSMSSSIWAGKKIDIARANGQANIVFSSMSSKTIVYAVFPGAGGTLYKLASYSSAGRGYSKLNVTVPYRTIFLKATTMPSAVGKLNHTLMYEVNTY